MRTVSSQLAAAAEYGGPLHGSSAGVVEPALGLLEAERPLSLLTREERELLLEKYGRHPRQVLVTRVTSRGVELDYMKACWQSDEDVAGWLGWTVAVVRHRLRAARAKIAALL